MNGDKFITSTKIQTIDCELDNTLRPKTFDEYIGQSKIKENLSIFIGAAKKRGEPLDHVLLYGPPGLGKTTISHIIANELGANIKISSGPALARVADLAAILSDQDMERGDVVFLDEIHRISRPVEESLYPAMEDFTFDIVLSKGPGAKNMRLSLKKFTLIGATTRAGMLTGPLRDRFGIICRLEMYTPEELSLIIARSARILGVEIDDDARLELARRSRGTPRLANRLLKNVRDYALMKGDGIVTLDITRRALIAFEVDSLGLNTTDRAVLDAIIKKFNGGPVGLDTIGAAINEDNTTVEDSTEPYLIQIGFIARTPRGRIALPAAYKHMGLKPPAGMQLAFDENGEN